MLLDTASITSFVRTFELSFAFLESATCRGFATLCSIDCVTTLPRAGMTEPFISFLIVFWISDKIAASRFFEEASNMEYMAASRSAFDLADCAGLKSFCDLPPSTAETFSSRFKMAIFTGGGGVLSRDFDCLLEPFERFGCDVGITSVLIFGLGGSETGSLGNSLLIWTGATTPSACLRRSSFGERNWFLGFSSNFTASGGGGTDFEDSVLSSTFMATSADTTGSGASSLAVVDPDVILPSQLENPPIA
mmetsp:Transcript_14349/g.22139  ORF Transcript_14349/g.22139 Transcript_14349/m.22139 type:complete len:249 (+) Transcript_14349:1344-2090(+)